ncbi:O-antigen ligase family protein [Priestia aryabhattai]|uniref:O-antigen ligase family protein n=1 Tax=Priestia aryabhattai TaxID=412384 RepID=UPI003D29FF3A
MIIAEKIFTNKWLIAILLLPYVFMDFLYKNNAETIFLILRSIPSLLGFLFLIITLRISRTSILFFLGLIGYIATIGISGLLNDNLSIGLMINCFILLGLCLYITYCMDHFDHLIEGLCILFIIVVLITLVLMVLSPSTAYIYDDTGKQILVGIFGGKNTSQLFYIPAAGFFLILANYKNKKTKLIPLLCVSLVLILVVLSKSGTAIIAASTMIFFVSIYKWLKIPPFLLFFFYIIGFFGIVVFGWQHSKLSFTILQMLGKDATLTNRTDIWGIVLHYIKEAWLLGYGVKNTIVLDHYYVPYQIISSSHDGVLEILLSTGAVGLFFFFVMLVSSLLRLQYTKKSVSSTILAYSIFSYLIISISESVFYIDRPFFWILLLMAVNINKINLWLKSNKDVSDI